MTKKTDKLQRLDVASPCESSWEAMRGDGRRRHCLQCDKHVYDFARLTPREIAGLLEATGGRLCGRVTRDGGGRLVTLGPPLATAAAAPPASRRVSPLVATVVAAVLGLGGATWADQAAATSPAAEHGAGEQPGGKRPQRLDKAGDAESSLYGRLANEAGEPLPDADVRIYNQLDQQERTGRTDAEGRFVFPALTAGIYGVQATVGGHDAAQQWDVLLSAGEKRQVGLTVAADAWDRIVAGEAPGYALGGVIAVAADPMRKTFTDSGLVVVGVAGKSVTVRQEEYTSEVRTDLTVSSVLKGETGERVISIFHQQFPDENAASRFQPGDAVLAFLDPREAEDGGRAEGYAAADMLLGLRKLPEADLPAYEERLEALEPITRDGAARPADLVEWLVATVEEPATRQEAVGELRDAVQELDRQAGQHETPVDGYAEHLRDVYTDFLVTGGKPASEASPVVLAAFLTAAQRERLTAALLGTEHVTAADLDLYELVNEWPDDRLLPWLTSRLETVELRDGLSRRMMALIAQALDDDGLANLQIKGDEQIDDLEEELEDAAGDADRQRLDKRLNAAEAELRGRFVEALGRQGGR